MSALQAFCAGVPQAETDYAREQDQLQRQQLARDFAFRQSQEERGIIDRSPLTYFLTCFAPDYRAD